MELCHLKCHGMRVPFMAAVLQACHGCPPNFMPAFLQSFHRYGIDNFHGHALKSLSWLFFWHLFKKVFQFLLPLHLFSSLPCYDKVPVATLPQTCTAYKKSTYAHQKTPLPRIFDKIYGKHSPCFHQIATPSFSGLPAMSSEKPCLAPGKCFFCPCKVTTFFSTLTTS